MTDEEKEPVVGATVRVEGSDRGTITDHTGKYNITVPSDGTLVFSFIGLETVKEKVKDRGVVNIVMKDNATLLSETVIIGYGSVARKDLTGAVGKANIAELEQSPAASLDQALAGRIAGLMIVSADGSPGSESSITLRGGGLSQDASPLFIIDGFPIENFNMNTLDVSTIETLEVLKDASSIAIYGSRAANGVIVINTKQGTTGKPKVDYNYNFSLNVKPKFIKMMGPYEYVKLLLDSEALEERGVMRDRYLGKLDDNGNRERTLDWYKTDPGYDWQDLVTHNSATHKHTLRLNGGTRETRYNVQFAYTNQDGIVKNTGMTRYNAKGDLRQKINKNIDVSFSIDHSTTIVNSNSAFDQARRYMPTTGLFDLEDFQRDIEEMIADGTISDSGVDYGSLVTPLQQMENEYDRRKTSDTRFSAKLDIKFLKYFTYTPQASGKFTNVYRDRYYNSQTRQGHLYKKPNGTFANANGINASMEKNFTENYVTEHTVNYNRKFNQNHKLDLLYGFSYQYQQYEQDKYSVLNISPEFEYLKFYALNAGQVKNGQAEHNGQKNQLVSSYGRANYNLMDRYLFTFTARYDGSSKFAKGNQWGAFPLGSFCLAIVG
ncbi:MAG: SusC/RagA family TonB-linked outer membrane protein [Bacteroides sp.]|nr:SusC/RagA family TonB-linked outer membrane protein [Bacteroides sp.]